MSKDIRFGTDGWRAVIAEDFTFANVSRIAQATADFWKLHPHVGTHPVVVIGYDRRFLSDRFARRTAEVLAGNGFQVVLSNCPVPTPAVSYAVQARKATGGVMITASHNPPEFNGFKVKAWYGGSADLSICQGIEELVDQKEIRWTAFDRAIQDAAIVIKDLKKAHFSACKKRVDFKKIAKSKIRFAHDALYGVGAGCFEELLKSTSCLVTTLNPEHDPNFGGLNPEPIAKNYIKSSAWLSQHPHDICLVTDGDADRVGGMLGNGTPLTTHQLICLLLHHCVKNRGEKGRVIKALTTTTMVDRMCQSYGLPLVETGVGFKYITGEMLQGGVLLGFEESGGIGFSKHIPERDGILAGLMLLEMLAMERKPVKKLLAELEDEFGKHRYARIDIAFPLKKRTALMEFCKANPPIKLIQSPLDQMKSFDGVKFIAKDGSWLMLRGSGTEPVLRIYAEAKSDADASKLLKLGQQMSKTISF